MSALEVCLKCHQILILISWEGGQSGMLFQNQDKRSEYLFDLKAFNPIINVAKQPSTWEVAMRENWVNTQKF